MREKAAGAQTAAELVLKSIYASVHAPLTQR